MIIESGLVKAGLVKTGLVRAISNINTRYFRRNEGTTDYATIPEVTPTGDFVISGEYLHSGAVTNVTILSGPDIRLQVNGIDECVMAFRDANEARADRDFTGLSIPAGVITPFTYAFVAATSVLTMTIGDTSADVILSNHKDMTFDRLLGNSSLIGGADNTSGILANLKIWDNGTLIRDYPLDDNSDDLRELASGQNGTVINGNASDWGLFQQQATGEWLGQELATINSTPLLGDDSDPEFITITSGIILDQSFRLGANFSNSGSAAAGCGWSTSRGVPVGPPFRSTNWVGGDFVGGDFTASSSGIQQLFGRGGLGVASYDNVSVKEVLNVA